MPLSPNTLVCGECLGTDGLHKPDCSRPNPSNQKYLGNQPYYGALGDCPVTNPLPNLLRNAVKCLKCNNVIESKHRHDFVTCSCGNISVDGGLEYLRRVGTLKDYEELSEYKENETKA